MMNETNIILLRLQDNWQCKMKMITLFSRIGSGEGIIGEWEQEDEDCTVNINLTANGTWSYDATE